MLKDFLIFQLRSTYSMILVSDTQPGPLYTLRSDHPEELGARPTPYAVITIILTVFLHPRDCFFKRCFYFLVVVHVMLVSGVQRSD